MDPRHLGAEATGEGDALVEGLGLVDVAELIDAARGEELVRAHGAVVIEVEGVVHEARAEGAVLGHGHRAVLVGVHRLEDAREGGEAIERGRARVRLLGEDDVDLGLAGPPSR